MGLLTFPHRITGRLKEPAHIARPLRITYPGALYHVTAQGNERRPIFQGAHDRERFIERVTVVASRYRVVVHAYLLMGNHCHLLVETLNRQR